MRIGGGDHMALNVAIVLGQLLDAPLPSMILQVRSTAMISGQRNLYG